LRNACALYNFNFTPVLFDAPDTQKVAHRLRNRAENYRENPLEFIKNRRLTTTNIFTRIKLGEINSLGFIRLKGQYLRKKIFLGSFQYKMARKSYITDLIKKSKLYMLIPNKKLEKEFDPNTKIIAVKMPSRFVRGINKKKVMEKEKVDQMNTTRRVYIQYTPYDPSNPDPQKRRKCDYINAWFCTCKNGRQLAGCCSHWLLNY